MGKDELLELACRGLSAARRVVAEVIVDMVYDDLAAGEIDEGQALRALRGE